jgi:glycosyltransferase involved in cell wall biosynthesis
MAENGNKVLYINNIPSRMPGIGKAGSSKRYLNKLKSIFKFLRLAEKNIWVLTPITLPYHGIPIVRKLNSIFLNTQIALARCFIGVSKLPIAFVATPMAALVIDSIKRKLLIYYIVDKYDKYRDIKDTTVISSFDRKLAGQADIVVTVSRLLQEYYLKLSQNCHYISHGVDFDLFYSATTSIKNPPKDMEKIDHPIIGYFGSITESNDQDIIEHIAKSKPKWSIVLIGEVLGDYSHLRQYPNIYFLGKKELHELPAYGKYFDVCMMNWKMNEWMHFCSPVKAKEYLAMGKPVVSVPIPEVVNNLSDCVAIATTTEDFLAKVEWELLNDNPQKQFLRIEKVRNEKWENKMEELNRIIEDYFLRIH